MTDRTLTVTLPDDLADLVEERLRDGTYASADEMVADGLRALDAEDEHGDVPHGDPDFEHWLQTDVKAAARELDEHPERAIPIDQIKDQVRAAVRKRMGETS